MTAQHYVCTPAGPGLAFYQGLELGFVYGALTSSSAIARPRASHSLLQFRAFGARGRGFQNKVRRL